MVKLRRGSPFYVGWRSKIEFCGAAPCVLATSRGFSNPEYSQARDRADLFER
jgi:hypothetical protein